MLLAAFGRKAKGKVKGGLDRIDRINRIVKTCSSCPDGSWNASIAFGKYVQRLILLSTVMAFPVSYI